MSAPLHELHAGRVTLRAWRDDDLPAWAALNADPAVMAHFESTWSPERSDESAKRIRTRLDEQGYGLWALQTPELPFAGFVGLAIPAFTLPAPLRARLWPTGDDPRPGGPHAPLHEIGWRLARAAWGRGDATLAARVVLDFARNTLRLPGVVSFTATTNERSEAVMRRLGMTFLGDFDHPNVTPGHRLQRHVLYAIDWR
jgi:RimJ/RimL family protein N-acetyltransferase